MKISKLIIPLLGLTSVNNANRQELLKLEKLPEISYEVSVKDNWDNYLVVESLTQNQITQLDIQNILTEISNKPIPINQLNGCWALYQSVMATCAAMPTYAKKKACEAAAWASYLICIGVGG